MEKLKFTVEKNADGYWAHRTEPGGVIAAYGETLSELREDSVKAYNLFKEDKKITSDEIAFQFDVASFFELYSEISASGISKRAGMQKTLLSEYVNGKKKPSEKQVQRIVTAIKDLGRELAELEIA